MEYFNLKRAARSASVGIKRNGRNIVEHGSKGRTKRGEKYDREIHGDN